MKKDRKRSDKVAVGCRSRKDSEHPDRKDSVDCRGRIDRMDFVGRIDCRDQTVGRKHFQGKQKDSQAQRRMFQNPGNFQLHRNWDSLQHHTAILLRILAAQILAVQILAAQIRLLDKKHHQILPIQRQLRTSVRRKLLDIRRRLVGRKDSAGCSRWPPECRKVSRKSRVKSIRRKMGMRTLRQSLPIQNRNQNRLKYFQIRLEDLFRPVAAVAVHCYFLRLPPERPHQSNRSPQWPN